MKCPICSAPTGVLYTRAGMNRRRECANGHRFTTEEKLTTSDPMASRRLSMAHALLQQFDAVISNVRAEVARAVLRDKGYLR